MMQAAGYRAFSPAPLPPADPPVRIVGSMPVLLEKANLALGRLDGSIRALPLADKFVHMFARREAVLSSQIEGLQSSLPALLAEEARIADRNRPADVEETANCVRAMSLGLQRLNDLPICVRLLCEVHAELMRGASREYAGPGEFRKTQNWIGRGGGIAEATHVPPPPQDVAHHVGQLEQFIHAEDGLPLLIKIGLIHAQFETIHPFVDGNGRVGRLLITFLLCARGALRMPVLYLSRFILQHRPEYYSRLQDVHEKGDWESWLEYFLRGVCEVSVHATETATRVGALREETREAIARKFGLATGNGMLALDLLFERPIVSVSDVQARLGTRYPAAQGIVKRMVEADILRIATSYARNRKYAFGAYIDLFNDHFLSASA